MDKEKQIEEMAKLLCLEYNENCHKECNESHDCCVEYDVRTLYNAGYRKQSEWISVEERLPEIEQIVLCCLGLVQDVYAYKGDNTWEDSYGYYQKDEPITHWMPLPEFPKMKGGE